jgi:hypothetical protein
MNRERLLVQLAFGGNTYNCELLLTETTFTTPCLLPYLEVIQMQSVLPSQGNYYPYYIISNFGLI